MGKGAALCLNGPYILSHFGPYSDGGTGKFSHCPCRGTVSDVDPFFGLGWGGVRGEIPIRCNISPNVIAPEKNPRKCRVFVDISYMVKNAITHKEDHLIMHVSVIFSNY